MHKVLTAVIILSFKLFESIPGSGTPAPQETLSSGVPDLKCCFVANDSMYVPYTHLGIVQADSCYENTGDG